MKLNWALFIAILSEFTGTTIHVLLGCCGCVITSGYKKSHLEMALSFGLALMICVHICAPLSGGHVNPWVSTTACVLGHLKWDMWLIYIVVQILGGIFGYCLLYVVIPRQYLDIDTGICFAKGKVILQDGKIWLGEFIATSVLIFVWAGSWDKRGAQKSQAFAVRIGFVYLGLICCVGYFTGASLNLALTLPPVLFHGGWQEIKYPILGQMAATCIISLLWRFLFRKPI